MTRESDGVRRLPLIGVTLVLACASKPPASQPATPPAPAPSVAPTTAPASAPCSPECADPFAAWLDTFPLERGGVVLLLDNGPGALEFRARLATLGLQGLETRDYGALFATWVPAVDCGKFEPFFTLVPGLTTRPPSWCFPPLPNEDVKARCANGRIPTVRCSTYGM